MLWVSIESSKYISDNATISKNMNISKVPYWSLYDMSVGVLFGAQRPNGHVSRVGKLGTGAWFLALSGSVSVFPSVYGTYI